MTKEELVAKFKLIIETEEKLSQTPTPSKIEQDARFLNTILDNTRREITRDDLYSLSAEVAKQVVPNLFAHQIAAV